MTASLLTVSPDATLGEAAAAMATRGVGAVVVLEGERVAAILTERDVMKAVAAGNDGSAPVKDWMTPHPDTIEPSDTTDHAASLMIHGGSRHLPVVLGGVKFPLGGDKFLLGGEVRWQTGDAELPAEAGFISDRIDLGGFTYSGLFQIRF